MIQKEAPMINLSKFFVHIYKIFELVAENTSNKKLHSTQNHDINA